MSPPPTSYTIRSGNPRDPWLEPDIVAVVRAQAARGVRDLLVVPIGFVCDHVEVLFDVDIEHRHQAEELGIRMERIAMLNDDPGLVNAVANAVRRAARQTVTA